MFWKEPTTEPQNKATSAKEFSSVKCPNCGSPNAYVTSTGKTTCNACKYTDYQQTIVKGKFARNMTAFSLLLFIVLVILSL